MKTGKLIEKDPVVFTKMKQNKISCDEARSRQTLIYASAETYLQEVKYFPVFGDERWKGMQG
jgi:hypothetical protein